jgi:GNAT superfamily N-acetyltransferase
MTEHGRPDPASRYVSVVLDAARRELGRDLPSGTTVVASADREGSTAAVAYPLGERTVIWCAPKLAPLLSSLNRPDALTVDGFVAASELLGGTFEGTGRHMVLTGEPAALSDRRYQPVELDRDVASDRELLAAFIASCTDDDLDEAELDLDELDAAMLVLVDAAGSIASYASARPWALDAGFDDIAVITHPDHRGRRLGAVVVAEFCRRRQRAGRTMFYSYGMENVGSSRVAETVGFEAVATVAAVSFSV